MQLCVSLSSATLEDLQNDFASAVAGGADLVEVRLDLLDPKELDRLSELETWISRHAAQLLFAYRPVDQGGHAQCHNLDRASTLMWVRAFCPRFVDFEYSCFNSSPEIRAKFRVMAEPGEHDRLSRLMLSEHHVESRPPKLQRKFLDMCETPAETVKLVWPARNACDNFEALDLLKSCPKPATAFCLGEDGLASRILGKKFGSSLTYCALRKGEETAAGQPTLDQVLNLYHWRSIDRDTTVYGLIGDPVAHSLSPQIHNAAFAACGLNAVYVPFRIEDDGFAFADFIKAVAERPWLDIRGFSVTSPHKRNAFLLTQEDLDPVAKRIESVNTLRFEQDTVVGINTDYQAAMSWLTAGLGCDLPDLAHMRMDVLGAGGLARSVVAALRLLRAEVTVHNRTPARAESLASDFKCTATALNAQSRFEGEVLINCTTVGMFPNVDRSPVEPGQFNAESTVFDANYNPIKTRFLKHAESAGCRAVDGLSLFLEQAALQFAAFTGQLAPKEVMREAALAQLKG